MSDFFSHGSTKQISMKCSFINGVIEISQPAPKEGGYKFFMGMTKFSLQLEKTC